MALLVVEKGDAKDIGKRFVIEQDAVFIGRATPDNNPDIALNDEYISRRHVEISFNGNHFILLDLNSTNGTFIDGSRIEPGKPYELSHDSIIGLAVAGGNARVHLRFKESPTVSTTRIELRKPEENNPAGWLRINEEKGEVWVNEQLINLSRKEFDLILCLWNKAGKICDRDELISRVWPEVADPVGVSDAAIDQLVHRLRLKIEHDPSQPVHIISRKGFGFMIT